jgi:hypothetical protein
MWIFLFLFLFCFVIFHVCCVFHFVVFLIDTLHTLFDDQVHLPEEDIITICRAARTVFAYVDAFIYFTLVTCVQVCCVCVVIFYAVPKYIA